MDHQTRNQFKVRILVEMPALSCLIPAAHQVITQGYTETRSKDQSMRVRVTHGVSSDVTLKTGLGHMRALKSHPVELAAANTVFECCSYTLDKDRFIFPPDERGHVWILDQYRGSLLGITIAKCDHPEREKPVLPKFFTEIQDVTEILTDEHLARMNQTLVPYPHATGVGVLTRHLQKPIPVLVLTGAPASGKTTLMEYIGERYGKRIHRVPEMATIVIGRLRVSPKSEHPEYEIEFQKSIYQMQRISEDLAQRTAAENGCELIICDRGLHDGAAYMPDGLLTYSMLFGPYPQDYTRYAGVICLGPPPRSVYEAVCGNNSARSETYEQAVALGSKTLDAWRFHRGLHLIDAGTPSHSWEDKRNAVIEVIEKYLRKS